MAITWGAWDNHMKVGIDFSLSGSTLSVKYYVGIDGWDFDDSQTLNYTGAITGSTNFTNDLTAGSHGTHQGSITDDKLVATKTRTVSPGSSYTFGVNLTGAYDGSTPSHSRTYVAPVETPNAPTGLGITLITSAGAKASWTQPSDWGGNDTDDYQLQYSTSASFSPATTKTVTNATNYTMTGLNPSTLYYVRVRGVNSAGNGTWSGTVSFTTSAPPVEAPSAPGTPTFSLLTPTSFRAGWTAPVDTGGSSIINYEVQVDTANTFDVDPDTFTTLTASTLYDVGGRNPNTVYYVRVRAVNSAGAGDWSSVASVTTLGGAGVQIGGVFIDKPSSVMIGGVFVPKAPQKRVAGAWVY